MKPSVRQIRTIRIDVPLRSACSYFFVDAEQKKRHPWWESLHEYLLRFATSSLEWKHEPMQNVLVARPELNDEQRRAVVRVLRTAPAHEVAEHRTLRRAVALTPDRETRLELVYFSSVESQAGAQSD